MAACSSAVPEKVGSYVQPGIPEGATVLTGRR